jgi:hypothetical protein
LNAANAAWARTLLRIVKKNPEAMLSLHAA